MRTPGGRKVRLLPVRALERVDVVRQHREVVAGRQRLLCFGAIAGRNTGHFQYPLRDLPQFVSFALPDLVAQGASARIQVLEKTSSPRLVWRPPTASSEHPLDLLQTSSLDSNCGPRCVLFRRHCCTTLEAHPRLISPRHAHSARSIEQRTICTDNWPYYAYLASTSCVSNITTKRLYILV